MNRTDASTIYTIGHGSEPFSNLEDRLALHHVQSIVDVRSVPYSKHAPDFRKKELEVNATAAGLGYRWLGDRLGGLPTDPELLAPSGAPDYAKVAATPAFAAGLDEVEALAAGSRVVLVCSELDPEHCHRAQLLAPALEVRGYRVVHIGRDGVGRVHQPGMPI